MVIYPSFQPVFSEFFQILRSKSQLIYHMAYLTWQVAGPLHRLVCPLNDEFFQLCPF